VGRPTPSNRPLCISATRSANRAAALRSCSTVIVVKPRWRVAVRSKLKDMQLVRDVESACRLVEQQGVVQKVLFPSYTGSRQSRASQGFPCFECYPDLNHAVTFMGLVALFNSDCATAALASIAAVAVSET
jgi:hypothetical protein